MRKMTVAEFNRFNSDVTRYGLDEILEALVSIVGANKQIAESHEDGHPGDPEKLVAGHTAEEWAKIEWMLDSVRTESVLASASASEGFYTREEIATFDAAIRRLDEANRKFLNVSK